MLVRIWTVVLYWVRRNKDVKTVSPLREVPAVEPVLSPDAQDSYEQPSSNSMAMREIGSGNVQVGYAGGKIVSRVSHHNHTHSHVTIIQTPHQAPANESHVRKPSSAEQSATLRRLDQLRDRIAILDFMERRFGTRMVINLKSEQLNLLNMYLDTVMEDPRNLKNPRAGRAA